MTASTSILTEKLRGLGINNDSKIVIYDRHGLYSSPRAWWLLKQLGHKHVFVLNGGLPIWLENGGTIANSYTTANKRGDFEPSATDTPLQTHKELLKKLNQIYLLLPLEL